MGVREYIFGLITGDLQLNALGITSDSTFTRHTVDTPQVRPLCILHFGSTSPGIVTSQQGVGISKFPIRQRTLTVWVHDELNRGDYDRIDQSLSRVRTLLEAVEGVNVGVPGAWLSAVVWEGESDDLDDDNMRTITRNSQFRLTGSAI